jgi:hypothetical protein
LKVANLSDGVGLPELASYDQLSSRWSHQKTILEHLKVQSYSKEAEKLTFDIMKEAVQTKDDLVDLINISADELVRSSTELPASLLGHRELSLKSFYLDIY